jgi:hypothetical protein
MFAVDNMDCTESTYIVGMLIDFNSGNRSGQSNRAVLKVRAAPPPETIEICRENKNPRMSSNLI